MPPWLRKFAFDYLGYFFCVKECKSLAVSKVIDFQEILKADRFSSSPSLDKLKNNYNDDQKILAKIVGDKAIKRLETAVYNILGYKIGKDKEKAERVLINKEWTLFSLILDRVSFCIYLLVTVASSTTILLLMSSETGNEE
ncbi:hypothetical protein EB796_023298 [Bugula neritina]|uniref:Uncharacterized protein n=1 Tax=Bugula neritina TaxID=10212 RepID=A0A7J7IWV3_BUGNE|nr:hypothetical protein EB796_023298 [Bugula neritina]